MSKSDDLISRQAAVDALGERPLVWSDGDQYAIGERNQYDMDRLAIETVPATEPERKTGKWDIYVISMLDGEGCRCSECGYEGAPYWDFCPNCGADMRGSDRNEC